MLVDEDVVQIVKKNEKEDGGGRGWLKSHSNGPSRISDREKKAPLKTWLSHIVELLALFADLEGCMCQVLQLKNELYNENR